MAKDINNTTLIQFTAGRDSSGNLEVLYNTNSLVLDGDEVNCLIDTATSTQMQVSDFTYNSATRNVYGFTINTNGSLTAWTRVTGASQSAAVTQTQITSGEWYIADFVVLDVADSASAPEPDDAEEAQQQGGKVIRVKIRKDAIRPTPPRTRAKA